jgi:hypothetical protein
MYSQFRPSYQSNLIISPSPSRPHNFPCRSGFPTLCMLLSHGAPTMPLQAHLPWTVEEEQGICYIVQMSGRR